jgi:hypothetical protein
MYMDRPKSEEHTFGPEDHHKMLKHVAKHLGLKEISTKGMESADEESAAEK